MRLLCNVSTQNRELPKHNISSKTRFIKSTLALCKTPKSDEYCLILFNAKNENGVKYVLKDNVRTIIAKFINEGKATIQLKKPPFDIYIQEADVVHLKAFLNTCKMVLQNKEIGTSIKISSLEVKPIKAKERPVQKLIITSRSEYPTKGFPNTIQELTINSIKRMSVDNGILKLYKLVKLDLSDNLISKLPEEIQRLPNLKVLNLSKNKLGALKNLTWNWIGGNLRNNLQVLNLSDNKISVLPNQIGRLKNLTHLILKDNLLVALPHSLAKLKKLQDLDLENNKLESLPKRILSLHLKHINLSGFCNLDNEISEWKRNKPDGMNSLKEISGNCVLNLQLYFDSSVIPRTVVDYLEAATYCVCGNATVGNTYKITCFKEFQLVSLSFSHTVKADQEPKIRTEDIYCSKCIRTYRSLCERNKNR